MTTPVAIVRNVPEPTPSIRIDWNLGTLCNYACSYCPERLHDGALKWPDFDDAVRFCERAIGHYTSVGRRTIIKFTGGEPTLYRRLIDLLRRVRELGGESGLNSNASRELAWWARAAGCLDFAVLTHHVEFTDTGHFVAVANQLLEGGVAVHVNVTMLPERFDECVRNASTLRERCDGISVALKPLLVDFGDLVYPYSDAQKRSMETRDWARDEDDAPAGGMRCVNADGTSRVVEAQDFILRDENHWRDWNCNAGIESLSIRAGGEIYRAACRQQGPLGNLRDPTLSFPDTPIRCGKESCLCLADIRIGKWRGSA